MTAHRDAIWPAVCFTLQRCPRTIAQLVRVTNSNRHGVIRTLELLEAEGLATHHPTAAPARGGVVVEVWQWEPDA